MNRVKKFFRTVRNYVCYCGIEKEEFKAVKKSAYISNFKVWKILHVVMSCIFTFLFIASLINGMLHQNMIFYLVIMIYSILATVLFFFVLKKNSIISQLFIYLSISALFVFGALITQNKPNVPATMFMVLLVITPMFMIDKPYFMAIELCLAGAAFLIWMYYVKPYDVWETDMINVCIFCGVGIILHIIANSIRIKEFVLTRKINIQKDTDELTGLKNKSALTRGINKFLEDKTKDKGIMLLLDIDHFKDINDTYGHDVGDIVLSQLGFFLEDMFKEDEIVGRFGGDEFIIFVKNTNDEEKAKSIAEAIYNGAGDFISFPDQDKPVKVSIGIALYHGEEKNYSEIFKKADIALYKTKAHRENKYSFY